MSARPHLTIEPSSFPLRRDAQVDKKCPNLETKRRRLRRDQRTTVNVRAIVQSGRYSKPTMIQDLSDGGLGLVGADGLFPGSEVKISLVSGENKTGTVRWWLAGSCGVQFHRPLEACDPFREAVIRKAAAVSISID